MIQLKEGSKVHIPKDEIRNLKAGKKAKVFVNGKYFYLEDYDR